MTARDQDMIGASGGDARFPTTRWSIVMAAGADASPESRQAAEALCHRYWYPIYVYVRRRGHRFEEAQDLTQGFFFQLLLGNRIARAEKERGRFRSWLLASLRNHLSDQWDHLRAQKRGGGVVLQTLDLSGAEQRFLSLPPTQLDADREFDRNWARSLLDRVEARIAREYARSQRERVFDLLSAFVTPRGDAPSHEEIGRALGLTEAAVRQEIYRLRQRLRALLRKEIALTVEREEDVDEELRYLISVLV